MSDRPSTVLIVGATGSIGRHAVAEALGQGYTVRALVRSAARARSLPEEVETVVSGSTTSERDVRAIDYAGVAATLLALGDRRARIALMTAIGTTRPGVSYAEWKLRGERLVRASGNPYTIVRPGWFDHNDDDQRRIVMLQGDTRQSGTPRDGVIARDEIARVLIDALSSEAAEGKTFELVAESGPEQDDLDPVFAALTPDGPRSLDGARDAAVLPLTAEPEHVRADLEAVRALAR